MIECRTKPSFIEGSDVPNDWTEMKEIEFWKNTEYRIKPESKYHPFNNAEECLQEIQKHQPLEWLKDNYYGYFRIVSMGRNFVCIISSGGSIISKSYRSFYQDYTFVEGTPFGTKE